MADRERERAVMNSGRDDGEKHGEDAILKRTHDSTELSARSVCAFEAMSISGSQAYFRHARWIVPVTLTAQIQLS